MSELFTSNIIDKNSAIPLYFQLYTYIENLIKTGALKENDKLPTEDELVTILNISRPTIRQAFKELSDKGYIQRQRSKGTVVKSPKKFDKFLTELISFNDELVAQGGYSKTKVLLFEVEENEKEVVEALKVNKYIHLRRLRYDGQTPVVYLDTYLPYDDYVDLFKYDMNVESLYSIMHKIGKPVARVNRVLHAHIAKGVIASSLDLDENEPVMVSFTTGYSREGIPNEYSVARYNGQFVRFEIELSLDQ